MTQNLKIEAVVCRGSTRVRTQHNDPSQCSFKTSWLQCFWNLHVSSASLYFQERVQQRSLKVHEKTTYTSRVNAKTAAMRKIADEDEDEFVEEEKKKEKDGVIAVKDDPQFTLAITRGTYNLCRGGAVALWLVHLTTERAVRVRALAGDSVLCSWARHFTLTVPLSTQVYKWVPAICWGNLTKLRGSDLRWTSILSWGSRNTFSRFMLQKPG